MYGSLVEISKPLTGAEVLENAIAVRARIRQKELMHIRFERLARLHKREDEARKNTRQSRDFIIVSSKPIYELNSDDLTMDDEVMRDLVTTRRLAFAYARKTILWVCCRYGVDLQDMGGTRRQKNIVSARHLAIQIICHSKKCKILTLVQIGRLFGDRDHTTILYAALKAPSFRVRRPIMDVEQRALSGTARAAEVRK